MTAVAEPTAPIGRDDLPPIHLELPPGFAVLNVVGTELDPQPEVPTPWDEVKPVAAAFAQADVLLSAVGVHELPIGGVGQTWLTVSCVPLDVPDAELVADGIALAYRGNDEVHVGRMRLPAGEAVSITRFDRQEIRFSADADPIALDTGTLEVQLPMAGYDRLLVVLVQTVAIEAWADVCNTAAEIARSVRWPGDGSD